MVEPLRRATLRVQLRIHDGHEVSRRPAAAVFRQPPQHTRWISAEIAGLHLRQRQLASHVCLVQFRHRQQDHCGMQGQPRPAQGNAGPQVILVCELPLDLDDRFRRRKLLGLGHGIQKMLPGENGTDHQHAKDQACKEHTRGRTIASAFGLFLSLDGIRRRIGRARGGHRRFRCLAPRALLKADFAHAFRHAQPDRGRLQQVAAPAHSRRSGALRACLSRHWRFVLHHQIQRDRLSADAEQKRHLHLEFWRFDTVHGELRRLIESFDSEPPLPCPRQRAMPGQNLRTVQRDLAVNIRAHIHACTGRAGQFMQPFRRL